MDKIYVTELDKPPLDEDTLTHYGVLGMKWGVRNNPEKAFAKATKKANKYTKKIYKTNKKYIKEAKKVSRFFGRKRAQQKVVRLNAKKDYLTAKRDKWIKDVGEKVIGSEVKRITKDKNSPTGYSINPYKAVELKMLSNASVNSGWADIYKEYKSRKDSGASSVDKKPTNLAGKKATLGDVINTDLKVKSAQSHKTNNKSHSSSIESKVANARKTGKYDMEFLERNLDTHPKSGEPLEGKALDDAYRKYLKNKK